MQLLKNQQHLLYTPLFTKYPYGYIIFLEVRYERK